MTEPLGGVDYTFVDRTSPTLHQHTYKEQFGKETSLSTRCEKAPKTNT